MSFYYKLKSTITELSQFSIPTIPSMEYLLHPNMVIVRETPLDLSTNGRFKFHGWVLPKADIREMPRPSNTISTYYNEDGSEFLVNWNHLRGFNGVCEQIKYRNTLLRTLKIQKPEVQGTPSPVTLKPEVKFGKPIITTRNFIDHYLKAQIANRYAMIDLSNMEISTTSAIDSYFPMLVYNNNFNMSNLQYDYQCRYLTNGRAISPLIANALRVPQIPTVDLCKVLGYTVEQLTEIVCTVRRKDIYFVFVGAGGTGINTAHWFSEILSLTGYNHLFRGVCVHEKENAELSNLLRFPVNTAAIANRNSSKFSIIEPYARKLCNNNYVLLKNNYLPYKDQINEELVYDNDLYKNKTKPEKGFIKNVVLYGAPDLQTRANLSPYGQFICATHANNSCSIFLNPAQDLDIQVETYGQIQLTPFFMNQLKMAISTLELLASDQDLMEQDKHILEYSFDGTAKIEPETPIHFPIHRNVPILEH